MHKPRPVSTLLCVRPPDQQIQEGRHDLGRRRGGRLEHQGRRRRSLRKRGRQNMTAQQEIEAIRKQIASLEAEIKALQEDGEEDP